MNRFAHLSAVLFALAACARPTHVALQPDEPQRLQISILPPSAGYGFWVNQPAYVALFDVVPGSGVNLMYPRASRELTETVNAGSSWVRSGLRFHPRAYFAGSRLDLPHLLVAVASRRPLKISHPVGYSDWITYKLGMASFAGTSFEVTNALFEEVVPVQPSDDWATAVYLVYPGVSWRENVYRLVRCSDGFVYVVNVETPVYYCPAPHPDAGQAPSNDNGGRRLERPERARAGSAITRGLQGGDLTVLRPVSDVVYRPPDPRDRAEYLGAGGSARYDRRSPGESGYTPPPVRDPGVSQPIIPQAAAPAPPPSQAEGGAKPEQRGGKDPKDP